MPPSNFVDELKNINFKEAYSNWCRKTGKIFLWFYLLAKKEEKYAINIHTKWENSKVLGLMRISWRSWHKYGFPCLSYDVKIS